MATNQETKRGAPAWKGRLSKFGRFLKEHKIQRETVAKALDVTPSYVSMIGHGKARPSFRLAQKITEWTKKHAPKEFALTEWT